MIKRRFYKQEHGDNSGSSDSSSSEDSDSSPEVDAEEDHEVEEEEEQGKENDKRTRRYSSPGSGYESEDSSNNQCDNDASDLLTNEGDESGEKDIENIKNGEKVGKVPDNEVERASEMTAITMDPNDPVQTDISNFILKFKSVFKCRLCPRILCLNETVVRTHLSSKRHARSKKLHGEGRLKLMLNSDGELEEEQETHAERHARILALSQKPNPPKSKDNGRQRQNQRRKKRMRGDTNKRKSESSIKNSAKKRRTLHTKEL